MSSGFVIGVALALTLLVVVAGTFLLEPKQPPAKDECTHADDICLTWDDIRNQPTQQ